MDHTPGKWAVDLETGEIVAADGQVSIGTIYGSDDFPCLDLEDDDEGVRAFVSECQANARLIAAAPDLLAACRALIEWTEDGTDETGDFIYFAETIVPMVAAAIAAAMGQE